MATKAEAFRYLNERSGPKKAPRPSNARSGRPKGGTARSAARVKPGHPQTSSKRVQHQAAVLLARAGFAAAKLRS